MSDNKSKRGNVLELEFRTKIAYQNPFADIDVSCVFTSPSKREFTIPVFYDGKSTWRVRFTPKEVGEWKYRVYTNPEDNSLNHQGKFTVEENRDNTAFVQACAGKYWGFEYETGEPCFLLGDTVYNLFGAAYCGMDIYSFLKRRKEQGFNIIRTRCQVSPFHPAQSPTLSSVPIGRYHGYSEYLTRSIWPWGGSLQKPHFDRFNLEYFHTVDKIVRMVDELDMGLEMIMQAWGFEYPFNARGVFVAEWEEMWMRYLIARYDAFRSVYIWTLMNEYEYYPTGDWHYDPTADRWALRMARWVKSIGSHNHPIAVHNGPVEPPFCERFKRDLEAIDVILFQCWGTRNKDDAWLAAGIEDQIKKSLDGWPGSAIFAEYGYERNPALKLSLPSFEFLDQNHTRRGAWRGAFSGLSVMNGFENTWAPYMIMDEDQPGVYQLILLKHFFTEIIPFQILQPSSDLIIEKEKYKPGQKPLCLGSDDRKQIAVYLPVGSEVSLGIKDIKKYNARWFNPRKGDLTPARSGIVKERVTFVKKDNENEPSDWVLVLEAKE